MLNDNETKSEDIEIMVEEKEKTPSYTETTKKRRINSPIKKLALLFITMGFVFAVVGFALGGANYGVHVDSEGVHVNKTNKTLSSFSEKNCNPFTSIDIDVSNADVEFIESEEFGYEVMFDDLKNAMYEVKNGKLIINQNKENRLSLFNFSFNFQKGKVIVYIPEGSKFEDVDIEVSSGNTIIGGFETQEANIESSSGDVGLKNITADYLKINLSSGKLSMDQNQAKTLDIESSSGSINLSNLTITQELDIDSSSGSVSVEGDLKGIIEIDSSSGDINFTTSRNREDFGLLVETSSGKIYIDGQTFGDSYKDSGYKNADNQVFLEASSGDIKANFSTK